MERNESAKSKLIISTLQKYGYDLSVQTKYSDIHSDEETCSEMLSDPTTLKSPDSVTSISMQEKSSTCSVFHLREQKNEQSAFHIAAKKGHVDVLRALVKLQNAREWINCGDRHHNTALHFAASFHDLKIASEMVDILLQHQASDSIVNIRGQTPLLIHLLTTKVDSVEVVERFVTMTGSDRLNDMILINSTTYLHVVIERNLLKIAAYLVAHGASINIPDENGITVSDTLPKKTLVKLICNMNEGEQSAPLSVARSHCKLCRVTKSILKDCRLCGRPVCKPCSKRLSDFKRKEDTRKFTTASQSMDSDVKKARFCSVCITVHLLRDKRLRERQEFMDMLHGCRN